MNDKPNRLARLIAKTESLPTAWRWKLVSRLLGHHIKLVGTARVKCLQLSESRAVFRIENRRRVQNHIGGVHAAAMALLAETATGLVVGMNVPDDSVPVIKTLKVDYLKRATGGMTAKANLTEAQRRMICSQEKGETTVSVIVTDDEGKQPIECEMIWAWVPKRRS